MLLLCTSPHAALTLLQAASPFYVTDEDKLEKLVFVTHSWTHRLCLIGSFPLITNAAAPCFPAAVLFSL